MATKKANKAKRKGGSKKKKHNTASAKSSSARKAAPKKNSPKKRSGKKHNSFRIKKNSFDFSGVNLTDLAAAGIAAISSSAIISVIADPTSYLGIGLGLGLTFAAAKFAPRSIKAAVVLGAGVVPAVNLINRVTNNAIGNTISSGIRKFVPAGLLGNGATAPPPADQGMGGMRRVPPPPYGSAWAYGPRPGNPSGRW